MKGNQEVMEILEAFDLTETYESAGQLAGADPKTVKHWVERRAEGRLDPEGRTTIIDPYLDKIEEWVELWPRFFSLSGRTLAGAT